MFLSKLFKMPQLGQEYWMDSVIVVLSMSKPKRTYQILVIICKHVV
jgi:hypothetical protein